MRDLYVTTSAVDILAAIIDTQLGHASAGHCTVVRDHDAVRAVAAPIVAAELRRLVDEADARREVTGPPRYRDGYFDGANMLRDLLADRADELDHT